MGAISALSAVPVLREYLNDPERAVRETCELSIARIEWDQSEEGRRHRQSEEEAQYVSRPVSRQSRLLNHTLL